MRTAPSLRRLRSVPAPRVFKLQPLMIEALCGDPAAPPDWRQALEDMISKMNSGPPAIDRGSLPDPDQAQIPADPGPERYGLSQGDSYGDALDQHVATLKTYDAVTVGQDGLVN